MKCLEKYTNVNKIPLVLTKYPKDVDIISFRKIKNWDYSYIKGFQYDEISDTQILKALEYKNLSKIDLSLEWEDDNYLIEATDVEDVYKHSIRVAALVNLINNGGGIIPVNLDTYCVDNCCSCICDGHHRIRALQYLKFTHFPAYCSGDVIALNKIIYRKKISFEYKLLKM